jgi:hypothetical protein
MKPIYIIALIILTFQFDANAQYYYNDIICSKNASEEQKTLKTAGIRKVELISIEENGEETKGFSCIKKISKDYKRNTIETRTGVSGKTFMTSVFNESGQITGTFDSSEFSTAFNRYDYDATGKINEIISGSRSMDDDYLTELSERHTYFYDENGHIKTMEKTTNGKSAGTFVFKYDDNNRLAIEKDTKTGKIVYYYYDDKGRLTDIVHTYENQKMVMDYNFEYDENGLLISMTTTE